MTFQTCLAGACLLAAAAAAGAEEARIENAYWVDAKGELPTAVLEKGDLRLVVLLPEAATMASNRWSEDYGGIRFDWSGRVALAEYRGHTFIGGWDASGGRRAPKYSLGTSEEFKPALALSAPGETPQTVLRIGVGTGRRSDPRGAWAIEPLPWQIERREAWIEFRQEASVPIGWGYDYTKRLSITDAADGFVIEHTFRNTGRRAMDLQHYCHNWFGIDGALVGPDYRLWFPFRVGGTSNGKGGARLLGCRIDFLGEGEPLPSFFAKLAGFEGEKDNRVILENTRSGAAVTITGRWAPSEYHVYARLEEVCPEPWLRMKLASGQERRWATEYTFSLAEPAWLAVARAALLEAGCAAPGPGESLGEALAGALASSAARSLP